MSADLAALRPSAAEEALTARLAALPGVWAGADLRDELVRRQRLTEWRQRAEEHAAQARADLAEAITAALEVGDSPADVLGRWPLNPGAAAAAAEALLVATPTVDPAAPLPAAAEAVEKAGKALLGAGLRDGVRPPAYLVERRAFLGLPASLRGRPDVEPPAVTPDDRDAVARWERWEERRAAWRASRDRWRSAAEAPDARQPERALQLLEEAAAILAAAEDLSTSATALRAVIDEADQQRRTLGLTWQHPGGPLERPRTLRLDGSVTG